MSSMQSTSVTVELCCGGIEDVRLVAALEVDRIELNCGMAVGGLTPSATLAKACRAIFNGPIAAMVRPREGGLCYSQSEFHQMLDESEFLLAQGLGGIATGFLTQEGAIGIARCSVLRARFPATTLVFHKAFDVTADPAFALQLRQLLEAVGKLRKQSHGVHK
jgi:copper homeostasis protein